MKPEWRAGVAGDYGEGERRMIWLIVVFIIGFIIGVIVGVVWTNIAINNTIGRHFGW